MPEPTREKPARNIVIDVPPAETPSPAAPVAANSFRPLRTLNAVYLGLLATIAFFNFIGAEYFPLTGLNLYLPQWLWALPGIPLWIATAIWLRRRLWMPTLGLLWVFGPLMGYCWHLPWPVSTANATRLRVMTYNVKLGHGNRNAIVRDIIQTNPDILLVQERGGALNDLLRTLYSNRYAIARGQYLIVSRFPIVSVGELRSLQAQGDFMNCLRCQVQVGNKVVTLYTAHLSSPRGGLVIVKHHRLEGLGFWQKDANIRIDEAQRLAGYIQQEEGPVLLGGDLNAPVPSRVCKSLFGAGLWDVFSAAGRGYGYTYGRATKVGLSYVRIDHLMMSSHFRALACWPGNEEGSPHRPVTADLLLPDSP
jgi:endonuclease/exonuclease/phosphatase (EEP) superfamily protein YafD